MRPSTDEYFLRVAELVASRSTCLRRSVGCVLVDQHGRIIGTGYNGVSRGEPHCNDTVTHVHVNPGLDNTFTYSHPHACPGADSPSGTNLSACLASHAEANALISCRNPEDIHTGYSVASPCMSCIGLLLNTTCKRIVFREVYPHPDAEMRWVRAGREWVHLKAGLDALVALNPDSFGAHHRLP